MTMHSLVQRHNDSLRSIITPEGVPIRVELAQRGERLGAALLDLLFIQLTVVGLVLLLLLVNLATAGSLDDVLMIVYFLSSFLLLNFWFVIFELRWNGQTPGKKIMKIRVVDARGGALTGRAVMARNVLRNLEMFLPIGVLGGAPAEPLQAWQQLFVWLWLGAMLALPFINRDRMRGGDLVAGTWVIAATQESLQLDVAARDENDHRAHHFSRSQLGAYGVFELQTLEAVLRDQRADVMAEVAVRIVNRIGFEDRRLSDLAFLQDFYAALRAYLEGRMLLGKRKADKFDNG